MSVTWKSSQGAACHKIITLEPGDPFYDICDDCDRHYNESRANRRPHKAVVGTFTCTIPDPPDPTPMVLTGTYDECVAFANKYAGDDWPFAVIRHESGQLVHLGSGYAYDHDEDYWSGTLISMEEAIDDIPF